jgi:hypothetical protein
MNGCRRAAAPKRELVAAILTVTSELHCFQASCWPWLRAGDRAATSDRQVGIPVWILRRIGRNKVESRWGMLIRDLDRDLEGESLLVWQAIRPCAGPGPLKCTSISS